jgi:hypothetical protein
MSDLRRGYSRETKWWFEEGSQFCAALDTALKNASLDWPIRAFLWSGTNSVHARDRAARDLSKQLRDDLKDPEATAVIIAHSHGGNVALRALQHLDSNGSRVQVITLATPFLRVFAHKSLRLSLSVKLFMFGALFITFSIGLLMLDLFLSEKLGVKILDGLTKTANSDYPAFLSVMALSGAAGFFIMAWLNEVFTNPHAALAIEELAHYDTKGAMPSRILVIRGVDDEAALSLAAGSIGSRLSFLMLVAVIPAIYSVVVVCAMLSSSLGLSAGSKLGSLLGWLMFSVFFGALILFFVPGVFKSFFGREFLINGMSCDIAVDSVPDTFGQAEVITLRPIQAASAITRSSERPFSLRWMLEISLLELHGIYDYWLQSTTGQRRSKPSWLLRHGIYNHPNCVDEILRWLRRNDPVADGPRRERQVVSNSGPTP